MLHCVCSESRSSKQCEYAGKAHDITAPDKGAFMVRVYLDRACKYRLIATGMSGWAATLASINIGWHHNLWGVWVHCWKLVMLHFEPDAPALPSCNNMQCYYIEAVFTQHALTQANASVRVPLTTCHRLSSCSFGPGKSDSRNDGGRNCSWNLLQKISKSPSVVYMPVAERFKSHHTCHVTYSSATNFIAWICQINFP